MVVLFLALIMAGFINQLFPLLRFEEKTENRTREKRPELRLANLDPYPVAFEKYYQDHFSFRSPLLDVYHDLLFYGFKVSPHPDRILVGTSGRLFESEKAMRIYEGKENFTDIEMARIDSLWLARKQYFDSLGIDFWWMIAPMAHFIYEEELPMNFVSSNTPRRVALLMEKLDTAIRNRTLDLYQPLRAVRDSAGIYFMYDNHWTLSAGFVASQELLKRIHLKYPQCALLKAGDYTWREDVTGYGNAREQIGVDDLRENESLPVHREEKAMEAPKYNFPMPEGFAYPNSFERHYTKEKPENGMKALFIIDSFGERLVPFLKEQFDESVFIFDAWNYGLNDPIVKAYQPDIVVYISFEKLIGTLAGQNW